MDKSQCGVDLDQRAVQRERTGSVFLGFGQVARGWSEPKTHLVAVCVGKPGISKRVRRIDADRAAKIILRLGEARGIAFFEEGAALKVEILGFAALRGVPH